MTYVENQFKIVLRDIKLILLYKELVEQYKINYIKKEKKSMKNLKKINWMFVFLIGFLFLEFLSLTHPILFTITLIIKFGFLVYALFYLLKKTEHKKIFVFLGIYFLVYSCYLLKEHFNFWIAFENSFTLFSLPLFILFFANYKNAKIDKKMMILFSFLFFILILMGTLFSIPIENISNLGLILFGMSFFYIMESNSYLLKLFYFLCFLLFVFFVHSTIFLISAILLFLVYFIMNFKKNYFESLLTLLVLLFAFLLYNKSIDFKTKIYEEAFPVVNERMNNISLVHKNYQNSSSLEKVLGMEVENAQTDVDIFTIFYSIGIIGMLFYFLFFLYVLNRCKLQKKYRILFFLFLFLSCFGNILVNSGIVLYFALFFLVSKNDRGIIKKDILFLSNMYPDYKNPHYGIFVQNAYELLKEKYSIDLVVMNKTNGKLKKLIAYGKLFGISFFNSLFNNYDSIYVHFISHTTIGVFLPALCSKNTKLVLNVHGNDLVPDTKVDQNYLFLSKLFLKHADIVVCPSHYFESVLRKNYKIPKEKIVVYPSGGVDTNKFKKIPKKTALKNTGLDSKYKYFGYISRIEKDKGYDIYLKAINELKKNKKCKDLKFLLVGSGREEEKLNALVKKYKLEKLIVRKPLVSQEELVNIYNSLEAFVYPTRMQSESLGLTGLEAMACGVLVIGSNQYGPSDYLIDKENSLTFTPTDYKELAKKMIESLEMKTKEKNNLIKNGQKKSSEYNNDSTKDILFAIFK